METVKKETAIRRLNKALRKRFQGASINISWAEMENFYLKSAQMIEMNHIHDAYNEGYTDCKAGLPNRTEQDESNTNIQSA
jgi:regulator of replication initiation timing